jgi:catechol 2,3-dioxygenase-like lactoylglutathione lyase family enzyme
MSGTSPVIEFRIVLSVDDLDAAIRLYRDALGLSLVRQFGEGDGRGAILSVGGAVLELLTRSEAARVDLIEAGAAPSGPVRLAVEVADSAKTAERLVEAGASPAGEPVTTPWGHRSIRLTMPDGVAVTLFTVLKD